MSRQPGEDRPLPLREALQQQIQREVLNRQQLDRLQAMQGSVQPVDDRRRHWRLGAVAAVVVALLFGGGLLWRTGPAQDALLQEIAREVAENHIKLKPLDVSANTVAQARAFFTQLDFSPVSSRAAAGRFGLPEQSLLGGRYCSIRGVTAAQLRYRDGQEGLSTLYQVAYDPARFGPMPRLERGESPRELVVRGLRVSMWVERDLLMVLVRAS